MAAAGGFWAKGTFFSAVENYILGQELAGDPMLAKWKANPTAFGAGSVKDMKAIATDALLNPDYVKTFLVPGMPGDLAAKLPYAMKQAGSAEDALAASSPKPAGTFQGVDFTQAEVEKLAAANNLTYGQMLDKLAGYKTAAWVNKWKAAAEGDGTLPKAEPKPKATAVDFGESGYSQAHAWGSQQYAAWTKGLTSNEHYAFQNYTTTYYKTISKVLREEGYDPAAFPNSKASKVISGVDSGLAKATVPEDTVIYRGANGSMWQGLQAGDSWHDKGFLSTSLVGGYAKKWAYDHTFRGAPAIMEIHLKKGQHGAYLGAGASSAGHSEYEMLLPRNATYTILKASSITYKGVKMPYYVVEVEQ